MRVYVKDTQGRELETLILTPFEVPRVGDYLHIKKPTGESAKHLDALGSTIQHVAWSYQGKSLKSVTLTVI